jgi:CyaY protein
MMKESDFLIACDDFFRRMEDRIDRLGREDIDLNAGDGKLSIDMEDGTKFILSRQRAVSQIWLAEPNGGWHYSAKDGRWICDKRGSDLVKDLEALLSGKLGQPVSLD